MISQNSGKSASLDQKSYIHLKNLPISKVESIQKSNFELNKICKLEVNTKLLNLEL